MAANNKILLNKFAQLFNAEKFITTTQGLLLATRMWNFVEPNNNNIPDKPAAMLNAINQRLAALILDQNINDENLLTFIVTLEAKEIRAIGPSLVADVMENPAYKLLKPTERHKFERQANDVFGFMNVEENALESLVLNEEDLRRMVDASAETQRAKQTAHGKIDNALTRFDNKYRQADVVAMCNGPKHYGNFFTPQANLLGKLRASYVNILGEKEGNGVADLYEDLVNSQTTQGEKNAHAIAAAAVHDETVMAIFKRRGINANKYTKAFLADEFDGSNKENQHFLPNLLKTFSGAGKTFGLAAAASFTINMLSNVPVIGNFIGPSMAIATAVKKAHSEYKQASQIAALQNRTLSRRDVARIAVNTAASVAPYAVTMAAGPVGRYIGAGSMMVKTFFADLNQQKTKLRNTEKLSVKDYLASAGKAILNGGALLLGSKVGSSLGSTVANNFDKHGFAEDLRAKLGLNSKSPTPEIENPKNNNISHETNINEIKPTVSEEKLTTSNITADQESLKTLRNHRFDLTDATRSTANPDNDRMYQMNKSTGNYQQKDWYDTTEYQRAINTLHEAGVEDADGAIRNLAGARMFKGGEYKTELNNLLHGKLTTNTVNKILEADSILDEHADIIGSSVKTGPARMQDYRLETVTDEPLFEPEPVNDSEPVTQIKTAFGPQRMRDYSIQPEPEEMVTESQTFAESESFADRAVVDNEPTFGPDRMTDYNLTSTTVTEEPGFLPNRMADYQINNGYDWRDESFDTMFDHALNELTEEYQGR